MNFEKGVPPATVSPHIDCQRLLPHNIWIVEVRDCLSVVTCSSEAGHPATTGRNQKAKVQKSFSLASATGPCFPQHRMLPVVFTAQVETVPASTWLQVLPAGTSVKRPNMSKWKWRKHLMVWGCKWPDHATKRSTISVQVCTSACLNVPMSCIYVSQYLYVSMCLCHVSMYLRTRYWCITLHFLDNAFPTPCRAIPILYTPLSLRWIPRAFDFWHLVSRYTECVINGASPAQQICCVGNATSVCLTCGKGQRPGESFKAIFKQRAVQYCLPKRQLLEAWAIQVVSARN